MPHCHYVYFSNDNFSKFILCKNLVSGNYIYCSKHKDCEIDPNDGLYKYKGIIGKLFNENKDFISVFKPFMEKYTYILRNRKNLFTSNDCFECIRCVNYIKREVSYDIEIKLHYKTFLNCITYTEYKSNNQKIDCYTFYSNLTSNDSPIEKIMVEIENHYKNINKVLETKYPSLRPILRGLLNPTLQKLDLPLEIIDKILSYL